MSEIPKNNDIDVQKPKEEFKLPDSVDKKNTKIVERLGFKKDEPINPESVNQQMNKQFDAMSISAGNGNTESQKELDILKATYKWILEWEGDINKKLELCEQFIQGFDIEASQEKKEWGQRLEQNASQMRKEAQRNEENTIQTNDKKLAGMKEIGEKLKEFLVKTKKQQLIEQDKQKLAETVEVSKKMDQLPGWPGPTV